MKTVKMAALAALLSTSLMSGPAFANKPPIAGQVGDDPQDVCDAQLTPAEQANFETMPINIGSPTAWVTVGDPQLGDPIGLPYGVGSPTASNIFLSTSYFRNGGSPNVWAMAQATLTYPQTGQMYETEITQQRTVTFDCHVHKEINENAPDQAANDPLHARYHMPPGLQSTGNTAIEVQVIAGPDQEVVTNVPFVVADAAIRALICISPNNVTKGKPGTWTGKNGFNAANCPAASLAAQDWVPSDNAPDY
jgi:hypothetical protein